jgi:hypothetical protein
MAAVCTICGARHVAARCGNAALVRVRLNPDRDPQAPLVVATVVGAVAGTFVAGPLGGIFGGILALLLITLLTR